MTNHEANLNHTLRKKKRGGGGGGGLSESEKISNCVRTVFTG